MENQHENEHVAATSPSHPHSEPESPTQPLIYSATSPFITINTSAQNHPIPSSRSILPITSNNPNPYPNPLSDLHDLHADLCSSSPSFDPSLPDEPHAYHSEGSVPSESQHSANYSVSAHNHNYYPVQRPPLSRNPSHSSSFLSNENSLILPSITTHSSRKLIKPNGRHKVNTLPPWAKSHDDDDLLFEPDPIPSASTPYTPPYLPKPAQAQSESGSQATLTRPSQQQQQHGHYQTEHSHAANFSLQNLPRSSLLTKPSTTSQHDSPLENQDWTITQGQINDVRASTHPHPSSSNQPVHQHGSKKLSPIVVGGSGSPEAATAGPSSTRRSLYRAMTTPSPVFQRFRPLITVNGQKKRATGDSFNPADEDQDIEEGKQTPTPSRHRIGPHQQPPDDRWWQFTLPTKYRRKVEEYLSRGGQGIGGVVDRRTQGTDNSPFAPPRVEMVEIDEDRRKVLALLKQHATPRSTCYSSIHSNDPQYDLQRYASLSGISPLYKGSVEDERLDLDPHPPTDFPLSAFSRKMSLTAQQQQIFDRSKNTREAPPALYESFDSSNNHAHAKPYSSSLHTATNHDLRSRSARIGSYLMHHPTAPLVCRLLNLFLTVISLAICTAIRKSEIQADRSGILGASTIFVLVVAPLGLIHNLFAIYCEYFGAPIGIWSVSWKMFHTLSELVFVSLWSAALALTMNDELRSPIRCQGGRRGPASAMLLADSGKTNGTIPAELATLLAPLTVSTPGHPAALSQQTLTSVVLATLEQVQRHHHRRLSFSEVAHICRLQASLVSIIFAGLALNTLVLVVSLFRIFIKVSRKY